MAVTAAIAFPVKPRYKSLFFPATPYQHSKDVILLTQALQGGIERDMFRGRPLKIESLEATIQNVTYDNKHLILT